MATTKYLWNPKTDSVVHETDGSNVTQATYTSEPAPFGPLVSQRRGSASSYYHFDALGSTRQLTNAGQTVTDSYTPSAWGEEVAASGSTVNPYRWVGRLGYATLNALSTVHMRRRRYRPAAARWESVDPIGFVGDDANLFRYLANSPVGGSHVDPSGTESWLVSPPPGSGWYHPGNPSPPPNLPTPLPANNTDRILFCLKEALKGLPLAGPQLPALAACFAPHVLWMREGKGTDWTNGYYAHCVFSCRTSKQCTRLTAFVGGHLKEFFDCLGLGTPDPFDVDANAFGRQCAGWETFVPGGGFWGWICGRGSCHDCCVTKYSPK